MWNCLNESETATVWILIYELCASKRPLADGWWQEVNGTLSHWWAEATLEFGDAQQDPSIGWGPRTIRIQLPGDDLAAMCRALWQPATGLAFTARYSEGRRGQSSLKLRSSNASTGTQEVKAPWTVAGFWNLALSVAGEATFLHEESNGLLFLSTLCPPYGSFVFVQDRATHPAKGLPKGQAQRKRPNKCAEIAPCRTSPSLQLVRQGCKPKARNRHRFGPPQNPQTIQRSIQGHEVNGPPFLRCLFSATPSTIVAGCRKRVVPQAAFQSSHVAAVRHWG